MIASVAGFNPSEIRRVGRESYALTLWAYLHREDSKRLESLSVERDNIGLAEMVAVGFHQPAKIKHFDLDWKSRAMGPVMLQKSREQMEQHADDLWNQHERALVKRRPVS